MRRSSGPVRSRAASAPHCTGISSGRRVSGTHSLRSPKVWRDERPRRRPAMSRIAALVPAYQAAAQLGEVLTRIARAAPDLTVLVVDDGSREATAEVGRMFGARVHSFAGNRGKGFALLAGFELLRDYDGVVTLDADGH